MSTRNGRYLRDLLTSLTLLMVVSSGAQDLEGSQTFYASSMKNYEVSDGLIDRCVATSFVTNDGRLHIIPCPHAQSGHKVHLYQFDGFRSYRQRPAIIPASGQWSMVSCGIDKHGVVHGFLIEDSDKSNPTSHYFSLDTKKMTWTTIDPPVVDGKPINIRALETYDDDLYLLGQQPDHIYLYTLVEGKWEQIIAIQAPGAGGALRSRLALLIDDDRIWTEAWNGTVYRIDRKSSGITSYPGPDINMNRFNPPRLVALDDHRVIYGVPSIGKTFIIDDKTGLREEYIPEEFGNARSSTADHYVFKDSKGQVLFVRYDSGEELSGWLTDNAGDTHNYTPALNVLPHQITKGMRGQDIASTDLTRSFFCTGLSFSAVEVTSREAVQAFPGKAMRGYIRLSNGNLKLGRSQEFTGTEILTMGSDKPDCHSKIHPDGDIVSLDDGSYVAGTRGDGAYRYFPDTDTCDLLLDNGEVQRLCDAGGGSVYMLRDNQLIHYNFESGEFEEAMDTTFESFVNELYVAGDGTLYLATSEGLYHLDNRTRKLKYVHLGGHRADQQVLSIYEDYVGRLWLGTYGYGLKIYNPADGSIRTITTDEGLSSNLVASTLEDAEGDVWVGTYNGITIYDRDANLKGYLYEESGLVDNECNRWSAFLMEDDRLFFGTPVGFSIIDPKSVKQKINSAEVRKVYPTRIAFDENTYTEGEPEFTAAIAQGITLPADNRSLRISYGLSNYTAPQGNSYAYKLDRPGNDWNYVGGLHDLSLTDLPHGDYDLMIKGTDVQGRQSANMIRIPLQVKRFFYQNWWFYVLCSVPFLIFSWLWVRRQKSERLRLESEVIKRTETIREQTNELKQLDKMKTRLYTNITHEFRTPLTVIRGLIDRVEDDEKAPELIKRNTDNLLNLVNQMLDLRKLESGNLTLDLVQDDIIAFLQYVGESFRSIAESRHQHFHFLSERQRLNVDFDPEKLTRVVSNLLSNAIKFTPEGGDVYLQVDSSGQESDTLIIKVTDTGIGIPADQQQRIFDRFYQVDDSATRRGEGTGIGLTLVSELVKLMSGTIEVFSTPGKGTTFVVTLPWSNDATQARTRPTASLASAMVDISRPSRADNDQAKSGADDNRYRILIVEDNPDVVHYIGGCLENDYQLSIALDGKEGLEKATNEVPDLVVSDVMMPEMDGFELCEMLKADERTSHIPIIMLTAKADHESRIRGLSRGADAYLAKPFNKEELLLRIDKLIEMRRALHQRYASAVSVSLSDNDDVKLEDAFVMRFRDVLIENISDENFGIDELCAALHLGRTQVHNKVKALTGKSTSIYMRAIRLSEARTMLSNGQNNVSEVAFAVGFSDPKYFAKVFKKEFGMTPSDWMLSANQEQ